MITIIITMIVVFVVGIMWGVGIARLLRSRRMVGIVRRRVHPPWPAPPPVEPVRTVRDTQIGGDHYRTKAIQPWDAMEAWMSEEQFRGFLRGNAIKYLARCDDKGGIEDLKKAGHYIAKLTEGE